MYGNTYIHESGVDVVAALAVDGDEERQTAVRRQHVHEAVLLVVPWQQGDAAVFRLRLGCHGVQGLCWRSEIPENMTDKKINIITFYIPPRNY